MENKPLEERFAQEVLTAYCNMFEGRKYFYHKCGGYNSGRFEKGLQDQLITTFPELTQKEIKRMLNPVWRFLRKSYDNPNGLFEIVDECNALYIAKNKDCPFNSDELLHEFTQTRGYKVLTAVANKDMFLREE